MIPLRVFAALAFLSFSPAASAAPADWFPPSDMLTIGVYYYPEAWPESQWTRDMADIPKLGMEFVHVGQLQFRNIANRLGSKCPRPESSSIGT